MATRSTISIKKTDGTYEGIYCHWDGNPDNQLPILNRSYNTLEKAQELIDLGSISFLADRVKPEEGETHDFDNHADGVVVAYHRDRGEDLKKYSTDNLRRIPREQYNYVFEDGEWKIW